MKNLALLILFMFGVSVNMTYSNDTPTPPTSKIIFKSNDGFIIFPAVVQGLRDAPPVLEVQGKIDPKSKTLSVQNLPSKSQIIIFQKDTKIIFQKTKPGLREGDGFLVAQKKGLLEEEGIYSKRIKAGEYEVSEGKTSFIIF